MTSQIINAKLRILAPDDGMAQKLREDDAAFAQDYNWAVSEFGADVVDAVLAAAERGA